MGIYVDNWKKESSHYKSNSQTYQLISEYWALNSSLLLENFCSHFYWRMISSLPHSLEFLMPSPVEQNLYLGFVAVPKYSQDRELSPNIELLWCQTMWTVRNKRFFKRLSWFINFFPSHLYHMGLHGFCEFCCSVFFFQSFFFPSRVMQSMPWAGAAGGSVWAPHSVPLPQFYCAFNWKLGRGRRKLCC